MQEYNYICCESCEKAFTCPEQKKSVTDDVVTIKLQHFILITLPHINVVTGRGQLQQSQHRLTMSWCRGGHQRRI